MALGKELLVEEGPTHIDEGSASPTTDYKRDGFSISCCGKGAGGALRGDKGHINYISPLLPSLVDTCPGRAFIDGIDNSRAGLLTNSNSLTLSPVGRSNLLNIDLPEWRFSR